MHNKFIVTYIVLPGAEPMYVMYLRGKSSLALMLKLSLSIE